MQCFVHEGSSAGGICRGCGKGVCHVCARDLGFGLACSDACARRVSEVEGLNRKSTAAYANARSNVWLGPGFFLVIGLFFLGYGLWREPELVNFATLMGVLFMLFGAIFLWRNRRWVREIEGNA